MLLVRGCVSKNHFGFTAENPLLPITFWLGPPSPHQCFMLCYVLTLFSVIKYIALLPPPLDHFLADQERDVIYAPYQFF